MIGVLAPEQDSLLEVGAEFTVDDRVFVPISTLERVSGFEVVSILWGEAVSLREIETAKRQIVAVLDANHGRFDGIHHKFVVHDWAQLLSTIESTTGTITALVSVLGIISLVVAGIGVMNIMLVSVRERTREIGTRKALGAQPAAILNQFMVEAVLVCGGGGLAGIGLAAAVISVIAAATDWPGLVSWPTVRLAFLLSFGTGLVFGLYPASRRRPPAPRRSPAPRMTWLRPARAGGQWGAAGGGYRGERVAGGVECEVAARVRRRNGAAGRPASAPAGAPVGGQRRVVLVAGFFLLAGPRSARISRHER